MTYPCHSCGVSSSDCDKGTCEAYLRYLSGQEDEELLKILHKLEEYKKAHAEGDLTDEEMDILIKAECIAPIDDIWDDEE